MRTRTSLIRLSPPRGAEPRSRRQSQSSQAAQHLEALFSPISKYGIRTKRHEPSRRWGHFGKAAPVHPEDGPTSARDLSRDQGEGTVALAAPLDPVMDEDHMGDPRH